MGGLRRGSKSQKIVVMKIMPILQMSMPDADVNPEPHQPRPPLGHQRYVFIAIFATILNLATGWLSSTVFYSPGGFISRGYGFPFAWKEVFASCPPPCIQANGTQYDPFSFTGDLLFFMAIAYAIFFYLLPKSQTLRKQLESRKLLGVLVLVAVSLAAGNYAFNSVYGTGNHWTGYGRFQLDRYSFQNLNLLTLWIIDTGPGNVTLTNLSITDGSEHKPHSPGQYPLSKITSQALQRIPLAKDYT